MVVRVAETTLSFSDSQYQSLKILGLCGRDCDDGSWE